ncbi:hypothetical protein D9V84_06585, partial [Bacteroidetes/Chlorobi group bacterium Naka2016]
MKYFCKTFKLPISFIITFLLLFLTNITIFALKENNKNSKSNFKFDEIQQNIFQPLPFWITYFGGKNTDFFNQVLIDNQGDIVAVGVTNSNDLPIQMNSYQQIIKGNDDIYIAKFNTKGQLLWSTYFGGSTREIVFRIGIDHYNRIWIVGETNSKDFPKLNTNFIYDEANSNGFIVCVNSNGTPILSTVIGGSAYDAFLDLTINNDFIYIVGRTFSQNFPVTNDAFQKNLIGTGYNGVIVRIDLNNYTFFSTYFSLHPSGNTFIEGVSVDNEKNLIIAGFTDAQLFKPTNPGLNTTFKGVFDVWVVKFDSSFNFLWSVLWGGSDIDRLSSVQTDSSKNIYLLGFTNSNDLNFPLSFQNKFQGITDCFVLKLDQNGQYIWGSYIGGSKIEGKPTNPLDFDRFFASLFVNDKLKTLAINFSTGSNDIFMTSTSKPYQSIFGGGNWDSYSLLLSFDGSPIYSTFLGGNLSDYSTSIFLNENYLIISGGTESPNFPITQNAFQTSLKGPSDAFLAVFTFVIDTLPPTFTSITDSCGAVKIISIADTQSTISGIESINPIRLDNVGFNIVSKTKTSAKIVVQLLDKNKTGYYKIEVTDKSNNKLILEDSLYANFSDLLRFNPSDSFDFGKRNFFSTSCEKIWLCNKTTDTIILKTLALKQNIDFSIPPSELPIVLP